MSAEAPCPLCVRRFAPEITTTELIAIGASVSEMCAEHRGRVEGVAQRLVAQRLEDLTRLGTTASSTASAITEAVSALSLYNSKLIDIDELRRSLSLKSSQRIW
jgi:hypothetical protein